MDVSFFPMRRLVPFVLMLAAAVAPASACSSSSPDEPRAGSPAPAEKLAAAELPAIDLDAPSGWGPTRGELEQAGQLVTAMPVEDQAWQVLMPAFWGVRADEVTAPEADRNRTSHGVDTIAEALSAQRYGGLFVRPDSINNARQVGELVEALHSEGDLPDGLPLLVSVDQEGGAVQRIKEGVTRLPTARTIGMHGDVDLARRIARDNGEELRALGFTMVLAPVADVDRIGNELVASRSYSTSYAEAAAMVNAAVQGYLDAGIIPVVKHFPGHGSVVGDSHHSLPVQSKSVAELMRSDLRPFEAVIKAGAPAVMSGHIAVPDIEAGMPASLSAGMVQGVLRERLGFPGLVVTDSQGMGPVYGEYGSGGAAVRSLLAGNDLVLNSPDADKAHKAVVQAVGSGRLPAARLSDAATRVVAIRLYQQRIGSDQPDLSVLRSPEHLADVAEVGVIG